MSGVVQAPAARPCGSCPYRRDVSSGVWAADEYAKLPRFDGETWEQDPSLFLCHRQDGRLCAGWVGVHDMVENLGVRIAVARGVLEPDTYDAVCGYVTDVALFASGAEAAAHGLSELKRPGQQARRMIEKLTQRSTT